MFRRAIIPTLIALGLFAYVLTLLWSPQSWGTIWRLTTETGGSILLLAIPYIVGRFWTWRELLKELDINPPFKTTYISFAVGEMTKSLPMGIYLESFLLNSFAQVSSRSKVGSYVATTAILALESLVVLPILLILGVARFHWLRLTLTLVIVFWLIFLAVFWYLARRQVTNLPDWLQKIKDITKDFYCEGGVLIKLKTLKLLLPVLIYFNSYILSLYLIVQAFGFNFISFLNCLAVFAFFVAATILIPIPTELGLVEFSGVYALISFGISANKAAIIMVSLRIIFTGAIILVSALSLLVLRFASIGRKYPIF